MGLLKRVERGSSIVPDEEAGPRNIAVGDVVRAIQSAWQQIDSPRTPVRQKNKKKGEVGRLSAKLVEALWPPAADEFIGE